MANSYKTILVTGAAGLIGSAVTRLLLADGRQVIACDNNSFGEWSFEAKGLIWERLDITKDPLPEKMNKYKIEAVVHCAAHPGGLSLQYPSDNVQVNAFGSMRVFEWCTRQGVPIIYLSSSIIYGDQPSSPIKENALIKPGTVYGVCKVACENYLKILSKGYGLQWTVLRLFSTYGAGHKPNTFQGIVNVFLTQLLEGDRIEVKGSLARVRDLLYVKDAARAIVSCLFEEKVCGCVLNVGTAMETTIMDIICILSDTLGKDIQDIEIVEMESTVGDILYNVANIDCLTELTGFKPAYDVRAGIDNMLQMRQCAGK